MSPKFAPLCWHEEHYRAQYRLAKNRNYPVGYFDGLYKVRSMIQDLAARTILSN